MTLVLVAAAIAGMLLLVLLLVRQARRRGPTTVDGFSHPALKRIVERHERDRIDE